MNDRSVQARAVSKISDLRDRAGLTQLELSQKIGVTETTIQNWEKGRAGLEQIVRVIKLCEALSCKPEDLLEYETSKDPQVTGDEAKQKKRLDKMQALCSPDTSVHVSSSEIAQ